MGSPTSSFWTLGYYQQYFDVDSKDVGNRLLYSMVPVPGKSFLQHHIRPRPDLYGPFWICVTLVFSIAISGNVADFLQKSVAQDDHKWHYDFHKVSMAATAVFSYASLLPAALYSFLWWAGGAGGHGVALSFLELLCLYGYSLAIYIPVSVLWLIQYSWWQWLCVLAGAGLSGAVLFMPIWPAVRDGASRGAVVVMAVVLALHLLLACGFMLYFFHVPPTTEGTGPSSTVTPEISSIKAVEAAAGAGEDQEEEKKEEKAAAQVASQASPEEKRSSEETKNKNNVSVSKDQDEPSEDGTENKAEDQYTKVKLEEVKEAEVAKPTLAENPPVQSNATAAAA